MDISVERNGTHPVMPSFVSFVQKLAKKNNNKLFSGWDQNDASEFLVFLLDGFHNALTRKVSISITGDVKNEKDKISIAIEEVEKKILTLKKIVDSN